MLLSWEPPPSLLCPRWSPPPTSGSSQPATTDHTCVPSATHTHNLILIVGNVSTLLCLDNKKVSKTVTTNPGIHMKNERSAALWSKCSHTTDVCVCLCVCFVLDCMCGTMLAALCERVYEVCRCCKSVFVTSVSITFLHDWHSPSVGSTALTHMARAVKCVPQLIWQSLPL